MIWYLLYPFRGTTEAPVLAPTHPLRSTFARYGEWAARHVKTTLSISVAVAFILMYPLPYLYTTDATNFTNGASTLPHHVWTDAQPLVGKSVVEPDVTMRSIWVHGTYMNALDRDILLGALELQNELLGPTENFAPRLAANVPRTADPVEDLSPPERDAFHISNGLTDQAWFFHSPLQYWSGSKANILNDKDIVNTVNERKTQSTSVNVTLRHSIVFSGKRFEDRRLVAADALVITLIHLRDSPVGRQWTRKAAEIASRGRSKWTIIPSDGQSMSNRLYEFQFRPVSTMDWILLSIAYSLSLLFLVRSLVRLRAVKSKVGLIAAVLLQILASIGSSFTICAIFQVDLSKIPSYAYPLVVLAISMENSLRLINTVMLSSSSLHVSSRLGEAFGETAHVAVASRAQNLLILWGFSKATYPGVAAFCKFGAIAIVLDFVYLSTFFLSVLSLDVRQRELSELMKASHKTKNEVSQQTRWSWTGMLRQVAGGSMSTRLVGSIVCAGFVFVAGQHFATGTFFQRMNRVFVSAADENLESSSSLLIDIHQARSPTSWLRLQDHETAREVINVVKPWAHSYVARVYDPLVFVLKGSDRMPHSKEPLFLPAVYDFVHHEMLRYVTLIVLVVAFVRYIATLLVESGVKVVDPNHRDDEPLLSVRTLLAGHNLDVVMMSASAEGHLVSIGLDRIIQIWDARTEKRTHMLFAASEDPFPVLAIAMDDECCWVALLSCEKVFLWNVVRQQWASSVPLSFDNHKPEAFFFTPKKTESISSVVVVKHDGSMYEVFPSSNEVRQVELCKGSLSFTTTTSMRATPGYSACSPTILAVSRKSTIHHAVRDNTGWVMRQANLYDRENANVQSLVPISGTCLYLVARSQSIDLVRLDTDEIVHTFLTEPIQPRSVQQIWSRRGAQQEPRALTLAYVNSETGDLVLHTFTPAEGHDCIRVSAKTEVEDGRFCAWGETQELKRHVKEPGMWEALGSGCILGVRKVQQQYTKDSVPGSAKGLRRRGGQQSDAYAGAERDRCSWEVWAMHRLEHAQERYETRPLWLRDDEARDRQRLVVASLGPMTKLGTGSVALAFGNVIKMVSAGHEHFDVAPGRLGTGEYGSLTNRRRKGPAPPRHRIALS